jgi:FtsP/CotA-like multicopper oxidase with cupredoxin domain
VERLGLGPAQRADVIVDVVAEEGEIARIVEPDDNGALAVADFPVSGRARVGVLDAPGALPPNPMPELGALAEVPVARMAIEGGAMRGLPETTERGRFEAGAEDRRPIWALAGVAGMPETPFLSLGLGETARIAFRNDTAFPHGMHLHGHHFREVRGDAFGPWRDTILVAPGQDIEIAFVADNPGDWLLHCHMVEHAAGGMMTWIRVS